MAGGREEYRTFVGGLGWNISQRHLQTAFSPYGKILDSLVVVDRNTGRPRGFGFVTFADRRAMEEAIRDMDGREMDGRVITVNKAQPRFGNEDVYDSYGGDHRSSVRESFRGDRLAGSKLGSGSDECFKCGRHGHWARDCPSSGNTEYGRPGPHVDRDYDRYGGPRYESRERFDSREGYASARNRLSNERYPPVNDRLGGDRFYVREREYERDGGYRGGGGGGERYGVGGVERYGVGGPARYDKGSYRERAHPYDAPRRHNRY